MPSAPKRPTSWLRCVRLIHKCGVVTAALVIVSAAPVRAADDPKRVAHDALVALVQGDVRAFGQVTLPTEGADALVKATAPAPDRKASVQEQIARINLSSQMPAMFEGEPVEDESRAPVGARIVYVTQLGGGLVPVVVVKTAQGWLVEPRYWIAERLQAQAPLDEASPATVAKRFRFHLLNDEPDEVAGLSTRPEAAADLTKNNNMAGADRGHVAMLSLEMPVAAAREGEVVRVPTGERVTARPSGDETVVVALLGSVEVPFVLRRIPDQGRVAGGPAAVLRVAADPGQHLGRAGSPARSRW